MGKGRGTGMIREYIVKISDEVMENDAELFKNPPMLVRCKDCKHNPSNGAMTELLPYQFPCKCIPREDSYFCADGELKDETH